MSRVHEVSFLLYSYEVDASERLSIRALCQFLQEAADQHATKLGVSMARLAEEKLAWVLHRLGLEVDSYPRTGASLCVRTWPTGFDRVTASRDWEVVDEQGRPVARASSQWVMVDLEKRALARLPTWATALGHELVNVQSSLLDVSRRKLAPAKTPELRQDFRVRRSDLDLVAHVNNVRYIEWALETVPSATLEHEQVRHLDVVFRRESKFGQTVSSQTQSLGSGRFAHRLIDRETSVELVQLESTWVHRE